MIQSQLQKHGILSKKDIVEQLKINGVKEGMTLEVHVSMAMFGFVVGGAQTVVDALLNTVGYNGTVMMAMHCLGNSEPTYWNQAALPYVALQEIRSSIPTFDKKNSDTYKMGEVVENLRRRNGIEVSNHPTYSYIAWGKYAKFLCNRHSYHMPLSIESPLGRIAELRGHVLMIGCDYSQCTIFHLAQEITKCCPIQVNGGAIEIDSKHVWKKYLKSNYVNEEFNNIGKQMENKQLVHSFTVGNAPCRLFKVSSALNQGIDYFHNHSCLKYYTL